MSRRRNKKSANAGQQVARPAVSDSVGKLSSASALAETDRAQGEAAEYAKGASEEGKLQRRAYDRVPLKTKVGLGTSSNLYTGFTNDVSEGGIFVATHQVLPIDSTLDLEVSFAEVGGPTLKTRGRVRWIREEAAGSEAEPGMGVEFIDLDEGDRQWIQGFVEKRQPIFFESEMAADSSAGESIQLDHLRQERWKVGFAFGLAIVVIIAGLIYLFTAFGG